MKNKIDKFISIFLAFVLGAVVSAYAVVRFSYLPALEKIQIRNCSMEAYKAVAVLELMRENRIEAATEFLEWEADEGLIGLQYFTSDPKRRRKLDSFAIQALVKTGRYRSEYPRNTKIKATDRMVNSAISAGISMSKSDTINIGQAESSSLPTIR